MQRSTVFFVLLALFASVTFATKFNVEIKKEMVEDSLRESELTKEELAEEELAEEELDEKPSPVPKKPVVPNGKEQNKPKPGNKKEKPEEVNANKIVKKIEKMSFGPPMKGEKPQEPIKFEPDSVDVDVDPLFSLPTPALGTGKKPLS